MTNEDLELLSPEEALQCSCDEHSGQRLLLEALIASRRRVRDLEAGREKEWSEVCSKCSNVRNKPGCLCDLMGSYRQWIKRWRYKAIPASEWKPVGEGK